MSAPTYRVWKYDPFREEENPGCVLDITTPLPKPLSQVSMEEHEQAFNNQAELVVGALASLPQGVFVRVAIKLMQAYCDNVAGQFHMEVGK